ncbi:MAG TPA: hypothetical protein VE684_18685 [Crenalkalicoccus sp.]|jgi:hypothetical protein|nr:hypothetical protein [Crenalkalicoccus sp.]
MIRTLTLASFLALGAGFAHAEQGPRLIGTGDDAQLVYDAPSRNVVGGGVATLQGSGDDAALTVATPVTTTAQGATPDALATIAQHGANS